MSPLTGLRPNREGLTPAGFLRDGTHSPPVLPSASGPPARRRGVDWAGAAPGHSTLAVWPCGRVDSVVMPLPCRLAAVPGAERPPTIHTDLVRTQMSALLEVRSGAAGGTWALAVEVAPVSAPHSPGD